MLIGSRQKLSTLSESLDLSIDNFPIKQVSTTETLGILIDDNMAWHSHIDKRRYYKNISHIQKDCLRRWCHKAN